jgi:hypothetical protein
MLVFNIFLVKTATATRDSCYRLDVENNSPEQKLECAFLSDHHECDPLAILLAPFSTFNTCFCRNGKNCQIIILKKCLVIKCQLPLIKSKRTVHPTWTLCFFWYLGTFAFMLISHVHSALEQRGTHQSLAAVHGTHTHHCFELIYLTNKKSTI